MYNYIKNLKTSKMQINKEFLKKLLPHIFAVLFFAGLTMAYFSPVLKGKELKTHDFATWRSSAEEIIKFKKETGKTSFWTNSSFSGMPTYLISPVRDKVFVYLQKLVSVWGNINMNQVFLYLLGFYFAMLVFKIKPWLAVAGAVAFAFSSYFFIIIQAGHETKALAIGYMAPIIAGVYLAFNKKPLLGSLLMAIFLALQIRINHFQITYYTGIAALIMVIVWFIKSVKEKTIMDFIKPAILSFVGLILALGVNIASIYTSYDYGRYSIRGVSELSHDKDNKTSGLDKDYATAWSYGIDETLTFLVPNFKGGASGGSLDEDSEMFKLFAQSQGKAAARKVVKSLPLYWGSQPMTSGPVYVGAIICFLFVMGLFLVKGSMRTWLVSITLVSIELGWGKNLYTGDLIKFGMLIAGLTVLFKAFYNKTKNEKIQNKSIIISVIIIVVGFAIAAILPDKIYKNPFSYYVLDYLPGYNKFRTVSMTLIIAEFAMPLLGILAIAKVFDKETDKMEIQKALYWSAGITAGLSLAIVLFAGAFSYASPHDAGMQQVIVDALRTDRASILKADALRSFAFILITAVLIWAVLNKKIKPIVFYPTFIALLLFDMYPINKRYLNESHYVSKKGFKQQFDPNIADEYILKDKDLDYRVLNLAVSTFNDATTSHYHKSIGGYHGAKMRRYQELIDFHISKEIQNIAEQLNKQTTIEEANNVIAQNKILNMLNTRYIILNPQAPPLVNKGAMGNAWFVQNINMVENADEEINKLYDFNPHTDAVVDKRFSSYMSGFKPVVDSTAYIKLDLYEPNYLKYTSQSSKSQLAVFSEIYYPKGWHAYIDKKPAKFIRANYVLRAMIVPEGTHEIEWRFEPKEVEITQKISVASSVSLLLLALGIMLFNIYKKFIKK